jgi:putative copper export protein
LRVASLINVFSPMALVCGVVVVSTGLIAALIHLPRLNALWTTSYGSALYRKLVFVALLFLVGAWNWKRTRSRLARDGGLAPVRRVATLEVVLAAVVLGLTAILVALEIPD